MDDGAIVELSHAAAAKLHHALRIALFAETIELDAIETARFTEARRRLAAVYDRGRVESGPSLDRNTMTGELPCYGHLWFET